MHEPTLAANIGSKTWEVRTVANSLVRGVEQNLGGPDCGEQPRAGRL